VRPSTLLSVLDTAGSFATATGYAVKAPLARAATAATATSFRRPRPGLVEPYNPEALSPAEVRAWRACVCVRVRGCMFGAVGGDACFQRFGIHEGTYTTAATKPSPPTVTKSESPVDFGELMNWAHRFTACTSSSSKAVKNSPSAAATGCGRSEHRSLFGTSTIDF
jgi:hypothetical protein